MSDLERYRGGGLSPWSTNGRAMAKDLQAVQRDLWVALAKDAGLAEFSRYEMRNTAELDQLRQQLAGDSEFLNRLLAMEEVAYVMESLNIGRGMFKPWSV